MLWYSLKRWYRRRQALQSQNNSGALPVYLPSALNKLISQKFLAIDCEMTGLDANKDALISIGWVAIEQGQIDLASAEHHYLASTRPVADSATVHGILDRDLAGAHSLAQVMQRLKRVLPGKVLVFHYAELDTAFLTRALHQPIMSAFVDTMAIERRRTRVRDPNASLQLSACRKRYSLPPALEHNALSDAIATAELFLAQVAHIDDPRTLTLKDVGIACS